MRVEERNLAIARNTQKQADLNAANANKQLTLAREQSVIQSRKMVLATQAETTAQRRLTASQEAHAALQPKFILSRNALRVAEDALGDATRRTNVQLRNQATIQKALFIFNPQVLITAALTIGLVGSALLFLSKNTELVAKWIASLKERFDNLNSAIKFALITIGGVATGVVAFSLALRTLNAALVISTALFGN